MGFRAAFLAHLRGLAASPRYRLMLAVFLGASWLTIATYQQRVMRELPLAVLDLDGTGPSRTVARYLDATPELRVLTDPPPTLAAAQAALDRGTLAGVVLVPDGFSADLKRGRRAEVLVAVDMSNVLVGRTASRTIAKVLATVSAGVELGVLQKLGTPPSAALAKAAPVVVTEALARNPGASFAVYLAPAFALFFVHLVTLFLAWSVIWPADPARRPAEALGRWAAVLVVALALAVLSTYGLLRIDGIHPASPPPVVALSLLAFVGAELLFAAAVAALLGGGPFAFQSTLLLGMLSLMFSGLTWPWDVIPGPIRAIASALPFTPFGRALRIFLHEPAALRDLAGPLGWLAAQAAGFVAVIAASRGARALAARARARGAA
ncbi:conserved hypothetical protein [Anaeromyxobacter sp. K]|uniref:ABC transporter permease n=1 Tax=Anaeromyxobacter sp. (strain K) TaxID=447217 RepID=UPI00015F9D38|nr:ABC transporter permease [Anaeromyxobacter sp. K]ACG73908.1 conserved hypothetical protein [Anaeromyxobacter sp. K]